MSQLDSDDDLPKPPPPLNSKDDSDSDDDYVPPPPTDSKEDDSDDDYVKPPPPKDDDSSVDDNDADSDSDDSLAGSDIDDPDTIQQTQRVDNSGIGMQYTDADVSDDDSRSMDSDDDEDYNDTNYLQKFDEHLKTDTIAAHHPELLQHNNEEVETLSRIVRNEEGIISDPLHVTFPFITKYERARLLGERAKQLNMGAKPLVEVGPDVIDGYLIALLEYEQKNIPFIIKRPLPNGGCEYWKFRDLETI